MFFFLIYDVSQDDFNNHNNRKKIPIMKIRVKRERERGRRKNVEDACAVCIFL